MHPHPPLNSSSYLFISPKRRAYILRFFFYYMTIIFTSIHDDIKNQVKIMRTGSNRRPERRDCEGGVASSRTAGLPAAPRPPPAASRLPSSVVSTTTFRQKATASGLTSSLVLASASGRIPGLERV
jgi:hypothetical protein